MSNDYSSYSSVTDMLSNLGWRSLENKSTDMRLAMFYYKIVHSLVAIPLPSYFQHPEVHVYTRHMHSLSYRQIHTSICCYKYSFPPYPLFFGTSYQLISSWFLIWTPLKQESLRSIIHTLKFSSHYHSFIFTSLF